MMHKRKELTGMETHGEEQTKSLEKNAEHSVLWRSRSVTGHQLPSAMRLWVAWEGVRGNRPGEARGVQVQMVV